MWFSIILVRPSPAALILCLFPVVQPYTLSAIKRYVTFFVVQQLLLLLLLSLTFSVLAANPKKLLNTVANPARGLLKREKRT